MLPCFETLVKRQTCCFRFKMCQVKSQMHRNLSAGHHLGAFPVTDRNRVAEPKREIGQINIPCQVSQTRPSMRSCWAKGHCGSPHQQGLNLSPLKTSSSFPKVHFCQVLNRQEKHQWVYFDFFHVQ